MTKQKLSRRGLFRNIVPETSKNVSTLVRGAIVPVVARRRPPGAIDEAEFLQKCTACMDCVEACPHHAVHTLKRMVGLGGGTPVMLPDSIPCEMCEGFPCAVACKEGALVPPQSAAWNLGSVQLDKSRCLPFMGPECGACRGLCPTESAALTLRIGRPIIDDDLCVGCGKCIIACPVDPKALELLPLPALNGVQEESPADSQPESER